MVLVGKIVLGNTEGMRGKTSVSAFQGIKPILKIWNKIKIVLFKWFKKLNQQFSKSGLQYENIGCFVCHPNS